MDPMGREWRDGTGHKVKGTVTLRFREANTIVGAVALTAAQEEHSTQNDSYWMNQYLTQPPITSIDLYCRHCILLGRFDGKMCFDVTVYNPKGITLADVAKTYQGLWRTSPRLLNAKDQSKQRWVFFEIVPMELELTDPAYEWLMATAYAEGKADVEPLDDEVKGGVDEELFEEQDDRHIDEAETEALVMDTLALHKVWNQQRTDDSSWLFRLDY